MADELFFKGPDETGITVTGLESEEDKLRAAQLVQQLREMQGGRIDPTAIPRRQAQELEEAGAPNLFEIERERMRSRVEALVAQDFPDFELESETFGTFSQGLSLGQPTRETILEKGATLTEIFGIPPEDIIFLRGSEETANQDMIFVKNPKTGRFRAFDFPEFITMADAGSAASLFLNREAMVELGIEMIGLKGAGKMARLAGAAVGAIAGDQAAQTMDRMVGIEQSTLEEQLSPERMATVGGFGAGGAAVGDLLIGAGLRGASLDRKGFEELKRINIQAKEFGLAPITGAEASPTGRSLARQSAATTVKGRSFQDTRLNTNLRAVQRELEVKDVGDMSTREIREFVESRKEAFKRASRDRITIGRGPASIGRELLPAVRNFENLMDEAERRTLKKIATDFKANNLSLNIGRGRQKVIDIARGTVLVGRADKPLALLDQPTGEFKRLVDQFLSLGDRQPVTLFDGRIETNPVEIIGDMSLRARKLLGSGDANFNNSVQDFVDVLDDILRNPVKGAPGDVPKGVRPILEPVRETPRGPGGKFRKAEVPGDFPASVDEYFDTVATNQSVRESMFIRVELEEALKRGELADFGRRLIDPRHPERFNQAADIMRASGRERELRSIIDGYRMRLLELSPNEIEREIAKWGAVESRRAARAIMPEGVQKELKTYARNVRLFEAGPIAKTARSMDTITRAATLDLLTDNTGQLKRLIAETGGSDGSLAKALRFNIVTDLLAESTEVAPSGVEVINPAILGKKVRELIDSGNMDLLFPGRQKEFLEFLPRYLAVLPGVPGMGEGLLAAQIAQGSAQILLPFPVAIAQSLSARAKAVRNAMFAMMAYNRFSVGASTRDLRNAQAVIRAAGTGAAAQLREYEESVEDLVDRGLIEEDDSIKIEIQQGEAKRSFEFKNELIKQMTAPLR